MSTLGSIWTSATRCHRAMKLAPLLLVGVLGLSGCAEAVGSGVGTAADPATLAIEPAPGTYHYATTVSTDKGVKARAEQNFSYVSDQQWVSITTQDDETMCHARVNDFVWTIDGPDCLDGPLFGAHRLSSEGPVQVFPLAEPLSGSTDWIIPEARAAVSIEQVEALAGTDVSYRVETQKEGAATWGMNAGHAFPTTYELDQPGNLTTSIELTAVDNGPEVVLDEVPNWIMEAVQEQEQEALRNPDPEILN